MYQDQTGREPAVLLEELRRAVAETIGADPETWPTHGNAPLAIAAVIASQGVRLDRARAALSTINLTIQAAVEASL